MERKGSRHAVELCGAVIGAGFASGREIAAFFARFGLWSWAGVCAATAVMGLLCWMLLHRPGIAGMPRAWQGRILGRLWRGMFISLMAVTGGAMLAGSGEVAALLLPLHGARWLGMGVTLAFAAVLVGKHTSALAAVSKGLILCLVAVVFAGALLPARRAVAMQQGNGTAVLYGLCYGGFNMALASPVAALMGQEMSVKEQRRCAEIFTVLVGVLLGCGNAVLLRHSALQTAGMPFIALMQGFGRMGYVLGGAALYMAALTTLTACLRGLCAMLPDRLAWVLAAVGVLSLSGLSGLVDVVYPALGGGCFLLLVLAQCPKWNKTVN